MLKLHRWIATLFAIPMLWMALTGTLIQSIDLLALLRHAPADAPELGSITAGAQGLAPKKPGAIDGPPPGAPLPPLDPAALDGMLAASLSAIGRIAPGEAIVSLELTTDGGHPRAIAAVHLPHPSALLIDPASGAEVAKAGPPRRQSRHDYIKAIHDFNVTGNAGAWIGLATGAALLLLAITGILAYLGLFNRRRAAGRRGLFWR